MTDWKVFAKKAVVPVGESVR